MHVDAKHNMKVEVGMTNVYQGSSKESSSDNRDVTAEKNSLIVLANIEEFIYMYLKARLV